MSETYREKMIRLLQDKDNVNIGFESILEQFANLYIWLITTLLQENFPDVKIGDETFSGKAISNPSAVDIIRTMHEPFSARMFQVTHTMIEFIPYILEHQISDDPNVELDTDTIAHIYNEFVKEMENKE